MSVIDLASATTIGYQNFFGCSITVQHTLLIQNLNVSFTVNKILQLFIRSLSEQNLTSFQLQSTSHYMYKKGKINFDFPLHIEESLHDHKEDPNLICSPVAEQRRRMTDEQMNRRTESWYFSPNDRQVHQYSNDM